MPSLRVGISQRLIDTLLSIYLYNERLGYTGLELLAADLERRYPQEAVFIAQVRKHAADERIHYELFKHYFRAQGRAPLQPGRYAGYVERMVHSILKVSLPELQARASVLEAAHLFQICRLIMAIEERAVTQVDFVLRLPWVKHDPLLYKAFLRVQIDEPSHSAPYRNWLKRHNQAELNWRERLADLSAHMALVLIEFPSMFLWRKRLTQGFSDVS